MLLQNSAFSATEGMLEDQIKFVRLASEFQLDVIVHLAAQAGVRYSLDDPRAHLDSNIIGTFNVMGAARQLEVDNELMASSSSAYGANTDLPFTETEKVDTQLTIYAATKKANASMAHSYAHLWNLPTTIFRFFTVYGSYGQPDLALFKFLDGRPIDIYNHGDMYRDFTHVTDLVRGIRLLIDAVPERPGSRGDIPEGDSLSPVAHYRVVNIGNSDKVRLLDFIDAIDEELGRKASRTHKDMQKSDVPATWANADLLQRRTGFKPQTDVKTGIKKFVA